MYLLRQPAEPLRRFIEHYWFVDDAAGGDVDLRVEVFVDARADLIFNFGAPYRREVIGGPATEISHSNLDAQRLVPIRIAQRGTVRVLGVRFLLGGVAPFSDTHLADLCGTTAPPTSVFGADAARLEAELKEERDPDIATAVLDDFFLGLLLAMDPTRASSGLSPSCVQRKARRHLPTRSTRPGCRVDTCNACSFERLASPRGR